MRTRLLILVAAILNISAQSKLDQALTELEQVRSYRQAAISPNGQMVAWIESQNNQSDEASLMVLALAMPGAKAVSIPLPGAESVAWSPDSSRLAILAPDAMGADTKQVELWVAAVSKRGLGHPRRLTDWKGSLAAASWSPDGRSIAVLFGENAPRAPGPLQAETPPSGVIDDSFFLQRLVVVDASSGKSRTVSPAGLYIYEYDWSPDSGRFVYTAAPGPGDDNWWDARLFTLDLRSGQVRTIHETRLQMANPRWSPDGNQIAFIEGIMSDEGATGGDVYTVPSGGGPAVNRTPGRKASPSWLAWLPSSQRLILTETRDGGTDIATLDLSSGGSEIVWKGDESIRAGEEELSISRDGTRGALIRSSWTLPPEVWAGTIGSWRPVTHANQGQKPFWGKAQSISWDNKGEKVQGWLLLPVGYDREHAPEHGYPLVVGVHGGPASARKPSWPRAFFDLSLLSAQGYFVLFPNPRGSYGAGEDFTRANVADFGNGDLKDILAGLDSVLASYPINPSRVGIGGWSYGGYMTMWAVTQTHRFHAAVAGAGIANWQSYYGENSIDKWMIPYFGASVYDDPAVYARSSPIDYIKHVETPTLVVVGDRDGECPAPQSFEFWHALKALGVKTQLVVYPNEGHQFHSPEHLRDVLQRTIRWFDEYLK